MLSFLPSTTAEAVCWLRAVDEHHPQRVVLDPFARSFLRVPSRAALSAAVRLRPILDVSAHATAGLGGFVQTRHRCIDDALHAHLHQIDQLVVLGAGYDSRGLRFADALAGRPTFEVDHPSTSDRKWRVLQAQHSPPSTLHRVTVDFLTDDVGACLEDAGHAASAPSFFVWEGVSMYLDRRAVEATLALLASRAAPGSVLSLDLVRYPEGHGSIASLNRAALGTMYLLGEPITFVIHPDDAVPLLAKHGWHVVDRPDARELSRRYVRDGRAIYPGAYVVTARRS